MTVDTLLAEQLGLAFAVAFIGWIVGFVVYCVIAAQQQPSRRWLKAVAGLMVLLYAAGVLCMMMLIGFSAVVKSTGMLAISTPAIFGIGALSLIISLTFNLFVAIAMYGFMQGVREQAFAEV